MNPFCLDPEHGIAEHGSHVHDLAAIRHNPFQWMAATDNDDDIIIPTTSNHRAMYVSSWGGGSSHNIAKLEEREPFSAREPPPPLHSRLSSTSVHRTSMTRLGSSAAINESPRHNNNCSNSRASLGTTAAAVGGGGPLPANVLVVMRDQLSLPPTPAELEELEERQNISSSSHHNSRRASPFMFRKARRRKANGGGIFSTHTDSTNTTQDPPDSISLSKPASRQGGGGGTVASTSSSSSVSEDHHCSHVNSSHQSPPCIPLRETANKKTIIPIKENVHKQQQQQSRSSQENNNTSTEQLGVAESYSLTFTPAGFAEYFSHPEPPLPQEEQQPPVFSKRNRANTSQSPSGFVRKKSQHILSSFSSRNSESHHKGPQPQDHHSSKKIFIHSRSTLPPEPTANNSSIEFSDLSRWSPSTTTTFQLYPLAPGDDSKCSSFIGDNSSSTSQQQFSTTGKSLVLNSTRRDKRTHNHTRRAHRWSPVNLLMRTHTFGDDNNNRAPTPHNKNNDPRRSSAIMLAPESSSGEHRTTNGQDTMMITRRPTMPAPTPGSASSASSSSVSLAPGRSGSLLMRETSEPVSTSPKQQLSNSMSPAMSKLPSNSKFIIKQGWVKKWTDYYNGWQDRWCVIVPGAIHYQLHENDRPKQIFPSQKTEVSSQTDSTTFTLTCRGKKTTFKVANQAELRSWIAALKEADTVFQRLKTSNDSIGKSLLTVNLSQDSLSPPLLDSETSNATNPLLRLRSMSNAHRSDVEMTLNDMHKLSGRILQYQRLLEDGTAKDSLKTVLVNYFQLTQALQHKLTASSKQLDRLLDESIRDRKRMQKTIKELSKDSWMLQQTLASNKQSSSQLDKQAVVDSPSEITPSELPLLNDSTSSSSKPQGTGTASVVVTTSETPLISMASLGRPNITHSEDEFYDPDESGKSDDMSPASHQDARAKATPAPYLPIVAYRDDIDDEDDDASTSSSSSSNSDSGQLSPEIIMDTDRSHISPGGEGSMSLSMPKQIDGQPLAGGRSLRGGTDSSLFACVYRQFLSDEALAEYKELMGRLQLLEFKGRDKLPTPRTEIRTSLWNLLKDCIGKDLSRIALPVNFNEPTSFLQRLAEDFQYSHLLEEAANHKSAIKRMVYTTCFCISPYASANGRTYKPFNPLLEETFELRHLGFNFLAEQVGHHPPSTAFHAYSPHFAAWGHIIVNTKFTGKSLEVTMPGPAHIQLKRPASMVSSEECSPREDHITYTRGRMIINNVIFGKLSLEMGGICVVTNHTTGFYSVIEYMKRGWWDSDYHVVKAVVVDNFGRPQTLIQGQWSSGLWYTDLNSEACPRLPRAREDTSSSDLPTIRYAPMDVSLFTKLSWTDFVPSNTRAIPCWIAEKRPPHSPQFYEFGFLTFQLNEISDIYNPDKGVLMPRTDSRFRPDQRYLEEGDVQQANLEKVRLEEKQRLACRACPRGEADHCPLWFSYVRDPVFKEDSVWMYNMMYWPNKHVGASSDTLNRQRTFNDSPDIF